ncbi:hypothetical protein GCM10007978_07390 [Shewanella hanedai]|uniref:Uncharacterized protein n=1 Tax=Shewanella hanedai TaxID=25 RepID=A0A553JT38_SHEHA|nr:hypothetical protein [Shewanella hanedai]TRY15619.1 hypothetical protein FN961_03855 [Shewanella hanedai]GGI71984.1 hypothetical protein GCM10007978_07390 [Shewanella hanedai]
MNILFNILTTIILPITILVQLAYIWGSLAATNIMLQATIEKPLTSSQYTKAPSYPLTGTEPKPEPMYPLTKSVLVNEPSADLTPLRKPDSLGYVETQSDSEQSTNNKGGK